MVIIVFAVVLIIDIIGACLMKNVANTKGYGDNLHAWAICFWLGMIGYLYIIALPDRVLHEQNKQIITFLSEIRESGGDT